MSRGCGCIQYLSFRRFNHSQKRQRKRRFPWKESGVKIVGLQYHEGNKPDPVRPTWRFYVRTSRKIDVMRTCHSNFFPWSDSKADAVQRGWQVLRILHEKVLDTDLPFGRRPIRRWPPFRNEGSLLWNLEVLNDALDGIEIQFNLSEYSD